MTTSTGRPDTDLPLEANDQEPLSWRIAPLIGCERTATRITEVTLLIPGILQTHDYARTVLGEPDTDRRVQLRMERADVLTRDEFAVELHAIVHEEADPTGRAGRGDARTTRPPAPHGQATQRHDPGCARR